MTCVLSMTPLYSSPCTSYAEDGADLQGDRSDNYDFNWINSQTSHAGLTDTHRCSTPCRVEASTGSSISCRMEVSGGLVPSVLPFEPLNAHSDSDQKSTETSHGSSSKSSSINEGQSDNNLFEMCNKTSVEQNPCTTSNQGTKRKLDTAEFDEVYIPSKRVSPFLNTPKERKDERKKILKISIKKLKQLDDPEAFLRRTVLVNNTMKRLQTELREEKLRSRKYESKKKSFSGYGVLNNNCLSNSYLFDDPFLSGVHEKITDDMTDTLMNNVFHDKPADKSQDSNTEDDHTDGNCDTECAPSYSPLSNNIESNSELCNMEICELNTTDVSDHATSEEVTYESSNSNSGDVNSSRESTCSNSCHNLCSCDSTSKPEVTLDRCDAVSNEEFTTASIINSNVAISKSCNSDNSEVQIEQCKIECIENSSYGDHGMECGRSHLTNLDVEKSTDVHLNSTDTGLHLQTDNSLITSKSAINGLETLPESNSGLDMLDLDQKLDQKSLSHSFSTFLSVFDIHHPLPISLSYKES